MRAPVDHIYAPPFPRELPWVNSAPLRMDQQQGRPVLIEFWDFCRANSLRTLPYLKAWHARYEDAGLRVIGVHTAGFETSSDPERVRQAVDRLQITYPIVIDSQREIWMEYENLGWPARYLFGAGARLFDYHYGEGGYPETELAIQELLGLEAEPVAPQRPEEQPGALLVPPTEQIAGPYSGPYEAGGVWAVLDGRGSVTVNGARVPVEHPGAYELIRHEQSTAGVLEMTLGAGVRCEAVCFTPGLAALGAGSPQAG
ncbi:MAG TPA: redoxin domain-containing protein [Solirubrobacteraceae bacterium]|nr:redoxin domain-containing protein [Solirubrobacteraceae bacterium]